MTIKQFIEASIEGGWKAENNAWVADLNGSATLIHRADILLDPLAWQAVGKVEGWCDCDGVVCTAEKGSSRHHMHHFIDALCDGKDLEAALSEATS